MQYIENDHNVQRVYNVFVDDEKLSELLNLIVKRVNYEVEGTFTLPYNVRVDYKKNRILSGANLPNGMSMFKNIKKMYPFSSHDSYGYYNDSIALEGTQVVVPYLAYIIKRILRKEINCIGDFLNYKNNDELVYIDDKIELLGNEVDEMDNTSPDNKISLLNELKQLCEDKRNNHYFDVGLLKGFYQEALDCVQLQLVEEKTIYNDSCKIMLKDLK